MTSRAILKGWPIAAGQPQGTVPPIGPTLYTGLVATRGFMPTAVSDSSNALGMSRSPHIARTNITQLGIALANWWWQEDVTTGENNGVGSVAYAASVEYPAGTFTRITFGGNNSGSIAAGGTIESDLATVSIPSGATFWIRVFINGANGFPYIRGDSTGGASGTQKSKFNGTLGQQFASGAGTTDVTMGGTVTGTNPVAPGLLAISFSPYAIFGPTTAPSVFIAGDSRNDGLQDAQDSSGDTGEAARIVGGSFAYINCGGNGDLVSKSVLTNGYAKRGYGAKWCTHLLSDYGINDIAAGATATTALANLSTFRSTYFASAKAFQQTISPITTSTDSWATVGNQTPFAAETQRLSYNASIRAGLSGFTGYFEVADINESARNSGRWKANITPDGGHEKSTQYAAVGAAIANTAASAITR